MVYPLPEWRGAPSVARLTEIAGSASPEHYLLSESNSSNT